MRVFVACWFFPPSISSEGIVTYKLLRNSRHSYDVCSSLSQKWSYKQVLQLKADNIVPLTVDTDNLDEWVNECVLLFEKKHAANPYDAIMTRSMPPESIEVGRRIHEMHPELPWIASIADPIAKSPYDIKAWIIDAEDMNDQAKSDLIDSLRYGVDAWRNSDNPNIIKLCHFKDIEDYAIDNASALIFPHEALRSYVLGGRRRKNAYVVHHSYDKTMYPNIASHPERDRIKLTFTGHSDSIRTLEPLIRALQRTKLIDETTLDKLDVQLIGHINEEARALIYNYDLHNCITIVPNAGYHETLEAMQTADWLIHVDAFFAFLEEEGGSVYFAGKIADYLGTNKPILAITGKNSPAYGIVKRAGGLCFEANNVAELADAIVNISNNSQPVEISESYRSLFDANVIAARFDEWMDELISTESRTFERFSWPTIPSLGTCVQKFLSICVPAHNVACYLDRCLHSLISCPEADQLEVIVVDDGSLDDSAQVALAYQKHYPSIIKVIRKQNGGRGSAINAALEIACGIYFRVIDGDDWADSANLATLIRNLKKLSELPDLVSTNYHLVLDDSGELTARTKISGELADYVAYDFSITDVTTEHFTMASTMMKTEILRAPGFKMQEHTYYVDVEYLLFPIPYIESIMFAPEYVYRYASDKAGRSRNPNVSIGRYDHHDRVVRRMVVYFAKHQNAMGLGQRNYMKSVFIRYLLRQHYQLSLIWNPDIARGFNQAKDFDIFLMDTSSELYDEFGETYPIIKVMRKTEFDPSIGIRPTHLEPFSNSEAIDLISHALENDPLGSKLIKNRMMKNIAMSVAEKKYL